MEELDLAVEGRVKSRNLKDGDSRPMRCVNCEGKNGREW